MNPFDVTMRLNCPQSYYDDPEHIIVHAMAEYVIRPGGSTYTAYQDMMSRNEAHHITVTPSGVRVRGRDDDEYAQHTKGKSRFALSIIFLIAGAYSEEELFEAMKKDYLTGPEFKAGVEQVRKWLDAYPHIKTVERSSDVVKRNYDPGDGFPWLAFLEGVGLGE